MFWFRTLSIIHNTLDLYYCNFYILISSVAKRFTCLIMNIAYSKRCILFKFLVVTCYSICLHQQKNLTRLIEKASKKTTNGKYSLVFDQTCIKDRLLPNYTRIIVKRCQCYKKNDLFKTRLLNFTSCLFVVCYKSYNRYLTHFYLSHRSEILHSCVKLQTMHESI
jgi:hypothetical protein